MNGKVSQLAEKLLKEGVERGEEERQKILAAAKDEANRISTEAQKQAEKIIADAHDKSAQMQKNAESEIALSGAQAISALKQKITDLVVFNTIDAPVSEALSDPKVMTEYVKAVLSNWKGETGTNGSVEVLLPESQREQLEKDLTAAVSSLLDGKVKVSFSRSVKGGFQVGAADGSYKITFSDDDFAAFFKEYLRPRVRTILFGG